MLIIELLLACENSLENLLNAAREAEQGMREDRQKMADVLTSNGFRNVSDGQASLTERAAEIKDTLEGDMRKSEMDSRALEQAVAGWRESLQFLQQLMEEGG